MPKEREDKQFKSSSGICNIHAVIWYPDSDVYKKPVGVIQIAHGMIDHIERFEEMAEYFTGKGFVVAGNDHLGHGDSVNSDEDLGYFAKGNHGADFLIKDMHRLTLIMKKNYPDLPYVLIGHSMGSYMSRKYASIYGDELDGVIFLGTGNQPKAVVDSGLKLAHIAKLVRGERYRSELLNTIMFGAYNKRIKDNRTANDWLTKDTKIVDEYLSDPKCSYKFTANAYIGFLNVIKYDIDKKNIAKTPDKLPVLFASGLEDPVGDYGKGVKKARTAEQHDGEIHEPDGRGTDEAGTRYYCIPVRRRCGYGGEPVYLRNHQHVRGCLQSHQYLCGDLVPEPGTCAASCCIDSGDLCVHENRPEADADGAVRESRGNEPCHKSCSGDNPVY